MKTRVLEPARDEAVAAAQWLDRARQGLGDEFLDELNDAYETISLRPDSFSFLETVDQDSTKFRRFRLKRFSYVVVYRIEVEEVVVAVAHVRRHPTYWRNRL